MATADPDIGNIQILVKQVAWNLPDTQQNRPDTLLQVEGISLAREDIFPVVEYLRQQVAASVSLELALFEEYNSEEQYASEDAGYFAFLQATLVVTAELDTFQTSQSRIAQGIITNFRDFLADSPPWCFDPVRDIHVLSLTPELEATATVIRQESPWNDLGAGTLSFALTQAI